MSKRKLDVDGEIFELVKSGYLEDFRDALLRYPAMINGKADLIKCTSKLDMEHVSTPVDILSYAIKKEKWDHVKLILESSVIDLKYKCIFSNEDGYKTSLYRACQKRNLETIQKIIQTYSAETSFRALFDDFYGGPIDFFLSYDELVIFLVFYEHFNLEPIDYSKFLILAIEKLAVGIVSFIFFEMKRKNLSIIESDNYSSNPLVVLCDEMYEEEIDYPLQMRKREEIFKMSYNFIYPEYDFKNGYEIAVVSSSLRIILAKHINLDYIRNTFFKHLFDNTYLTNRNSLKDLAREILAYDYSNGWPALLLHDEITRVQVKGKKVGTLNFNINSSLECKINAIQ